jgi:hypothetical protein
MINSRKLSVEPDHAQSSSTGNALTCSLCSMAAMSL